jgi:hypothetical protein
MQFFSLTPITLDLSEADRHSGRKRSDSVAQDERAPGETARMVVLKSKMLQHFPRRSGQPTQGAEILRTAVDQVCFCAWDHKVNDRLIRLGN